MNTVLLMTPPVAARRVRVGTLPETVSFVTTLTHKIGVIVGRNGAGVQVLLNGVSKVLHPEVIVVPLEEVR